MQYATHMTAPQKAIPLSHDGYYGEFVICNMTRNDIMMIDRCNNRYIIAPCFEQSHRDIIEVIHRHCNGTRLNRSTTPPTEAAINASTLRMASYALAQGPVTIESVGVVLADPVVGATYSHPECQKDYTEELYKAIGNIVTNDDTTTVRMFINDPAGTHDAVYGAIGQSVFEIACTHLADAADHPTMSVIVTSNNKTYVQSRFDISTLFEVGSWSHEDETVRMSLGLTAQEALDATEKHKKLFDTRVFEATNLRMETERERHKKDLEQQDQRYKELEATQKDERSKHAADINNQKREIEDLRRELNAEKAKSQEWQSMHEAATKHASATERLAAEESKRREQEERTRRAKEATKAERVKFAHTAFKIVGGFVVGVVVPYAIKKAQEKKEI